MLLSAAFGATGAAAAELPPAQGRFLVAAQEMVDPNFGKTIILLLKYGEQGAMGLVVNRPTAVLPEQVIPGIDGLRRYDGPLFFGGPVQVNVVTFLVRETAELESGQFVLTDVQYSTDPELLAALTEDDTDAARLRVYAGYAGWAPGQLDDEIARGGWHVVPASSELVFSGEPASLWKELAPLPEPLSASVRDAAGRGLPRRGRHGPVAVTTDGTRCCDAALRLRR